MKFSVLTQEVRACLIDPPRREYGLVQRQMLSVASPKACFSRTVKKMLDNCAGTQPCFTSLWMSKGSDQLSFKDHSALHVLDRERI